MKGTGNSTLKFTNDPLWQKIDSFPIDDPASLFPFSRKLAQENNWHPAFIERAIREYKRFVYLCCTIPEGASPPPVVDEVWHLHMLYTENYWEEFCEKTLGRKLHHRPSRGGPEEKEKHVNWLQASIENYRLVFDENPPEDIWQTEDPDHPPQTSPKEGSVIQWRYVLTCVVAVLIAGYFGVAQ
jgi:hypothetical protein